MKKISEIKRANKKLDKQMKKDTQKNCKKCKKAENEAFQFKIVCLDRKTPTLDLIITAIGRCCALFTKAFIVGLAIKTVLF